MDAKKILLAVLALSVFCATVQGYVYIDSEWQYLPGETPEFYVSSWDESGSIEVSLYRLDTDTIHEAISSTQDSLTDEIEQGFISSKTITIYNERRKEFSFGALDPGMYIVRAIASESNASQAFIISDMGLMSKQSDSGLLVYVVDLITGEPVSGASVSVYQDSNKESKICDGSGLVEFSSFDGDSEIIAEKDGSVAVLSSYFYDYYYSRASVYTYTDRPVYRPSQDVYYKSIIWDKDKGYVINQTNVTVRIEDNKGNQVYKEARDISEYGTVSGKFTLGEEPPLGYYSIMIDYDGRTYYQSFQVEEYQKPEYEVTVSATKDYFISGDTVVFDINADYYFGNPVTDAEVEWTIRKSEYYFPAWRGDYDWYYSSTVYPSSIAYDFAYDYDDYYGYYGDVIASGTGTLDTSGTLRVEQMVNVSRNSRVYLEAKVVDRSRKEVESAGATLVAAGEFNYWVETDKWSYSPGEQVKITVHSEDIETQPISAYGTVTVSHRIWENKKYTKTQIYTTDFETSESGMKLLSFTPDQEGRFIIEVNGTDARGNKISATDSFYVYDRDRVYKDYWADLEIITDKQSYDVGDTATVQINSPVEGFTALITIEADNLYTKALISSEGTSAILEIPVLAEYQPNVVINAYVVRNMTLYQARQNLVVPPVEQFLDVEIIPNKDTYAPREEAEFKVITKDSDGNPVSTDLSLGIVDESIYAIVEESIQNIEQFFYPLRYSSVNTQNSWMWGGRAGYALEESAQNVAPTAVGLDSDTLEMADGEFSAKSASGLVEADFIRKYFPDTAFWHADIITDENGEATVKLTMPDSLTTWRTTVRAINTDFQVGQQTAEVISTKDLIVRLETPVFLTQNDDVMITGVVHNYLGSMKNVQLELSADGVTLLDDAVKTVAVAHGADEAVNWVIRADSCCSANFTIKALTDEESDAVNSVLQVMPYGVETTDSWAGRVEDSVEKELTVPENSVYGATELTLTLSPTIAAAALDAVDYLMTYPYGCIEQTMSSFIPAIILTNVMEEFDVTIENEDELPKIVADGLQRIYKFQHSDGGWGWWEDDDTQSYYTAYVVYGLMQAKEAGYDVDANVLSRGVASLRTQYKTEEDVNMKAYMAYALSFVGEVEPPSINANNMSDYGKALVLLAQQNLGQKVEFPDSLRESAICDEFYCHWSAETFKYSWHYNDIETTSYVLMALLEYNPDDPMVDSAVRWLMANRRSNRWTSTKDTATVVFALSEYMLTTQEAEGDYNVNIYLNGDLVKSMSRASMPLEGTELSLDAPVGKNTVRIEKDSDGKLYYSLFLSYFETEEPITAKSAGITVSRQYSTSSVQTGDIINVTLKISASNNQETIIVEDALPAGCEVIESNSYAIPYYYDDFYYEDYYWGGWDYNRREVRDEKIVFFLTYLPKGTKEITYQLRAIVPGEYTALPARAWNMYEEKYNGHSAEQKLVISDKIRVSIQDLVIGTDSVSFTVNALKFVDEDLSGEMTVTLEDADGNELYSKTEYLGLASIEEGKLELLIPVSLEDGIYTISYSLTPAEGQPITGSKRIQVGDVDGVGGLEPETTGDDSSLLIVLVVAIVACLAAIWFIHRGKK